MTTETKAAEKTPTIRVHTVDRDRLNAIKEAQKFTGNFPDFMTAFIDRSTGVELFQDKDYAKLKAAADRLGVSVESIIIKGALKFAAKAMTADPEKQLNSVDMKVQEFVEGVMESNTKAKEWFDKREITQGFIVKSIKESTGKEVNRANVTAYLAANVEEVAAHHEKNGIEPDHNRKVFNYERKNKKA
jgi:hypothetical protein